MERGALILSSANEVTEKWVMNKIPQKVLLEGIKLTIGPRAEILPTTKVSVKTPKMFANTDSKSIIKMLKEQNKSLT